jgi:hypothetical protein
MIGSTIFLVLLLSLVTKMVIDVQKFKKRRTQEENELLNEIEEETI